MLASAPIATETVLLLLAVLPSANRAVFTEALPALANLLIAPLLPQLTDFQQALFWILLAYTV
jgi:cell division inhibitor SulA